jgi:tetratricopeptide (TPR) repeat protein
MGIRLGLVFVVCTALSAQARADKSAEAKALFQEANAHFAVGEFNDAGRKYQEAYKLKPDAALLYNAAQSYRLGGDSQKALVLYKNYVQFYPKAPNVEVVHQQIVKLEEAIAATESAKTSPPRGTAEHGEPEPAKPPETKPPETTPPPVATTTPATPPPSDHPKPIYKKWWLWTIVGGVVVVGVVVGVAVAETTASGPWQTAKDIGPGAALSSAGLKVRW